MNADITDINGALNILRKSKLVNLNSISEEQVREIIRKSGEFIRTHNVAECRNFIDSYIERIIIYDDRVDIIFKVNVFDKARQSYRNSCQMKSENTREAVESSYYAKKRSGTGRKTDGKS